MLYSVLLKGYMAEGIFNNIWGDQTYLSGPCQTPSISTGYLQEGPQKSPKSTDTVFKRSTRSHKITVNWHTGKIPSLQLSLFKFQTISASLILACNSATISDISLFLFMRTYVMFRTTAFVTQVGMHSISRRTCSLTIADDKIPVVH